LAKKLNFTCDGVSVHVVDEIDIGEDGHGDPLGSADEVGTLHRGRVHARFLARALDENWHLGALHVGFELLVAVVC